MIEHFHLLTLLHKCRDLFVFFVRQHGPLSHVHVDHTPLGIRKGGTRWGIVTALAVLTP